MANKKIFERLSKNVIPSNYILKFKPDLQKYNFDGSEEISFEVKESTKTITLNSLEIEILSVRYLSSEQDIKEGIETSYSIEDETATFTFLEEIKAGKGTLFLKFQGQLNDKLKGFYRSKYTHPSGEERFAAVTQFEPTFARRAFPCLDDPVLKATFDVSLTVPKDRVALSNMPVLSQSDHSTEPSLQTIIFQQTPVMSTYLVAMVVGEFDWVEGKDVDGVLVRVYTPLGKKEQGKFALNVSIKTLPFYKDYFSIAYPLPKMDLIAIPDFALGGMENWGLITYREPVLLVNEAASSTATKQQVALVVGHEISHMWFGNLVTMEWWSSLWLKEGFASWIAYLCVDHCFPEFDIWTQFASLDLFDALILDALKNSHPIEVEVGNPSEINEIFDAISYDKGASVIRMLHDHMGDAAFRKGLFLYLNKHQYSSSTTQDLWSALEKASDKAISKVMSSWTKQMGFPVIEVSDVHQEGKRLLKLKQHRFIADGSQDELSPSWIVPISIKILAPSSSSSSSSSVLKHVLEEKEGEVVLEGVDSKQVVIVNTGGVGFYRVLYSTPLLDNLLPCISQMSPLDRLVVLNDLFALSRAGLTKTRDVLKVAQMYKDEENFTVWSCLNSNLSSILLLLQHTSAIHSFHQFLIKLFRPAFERIGWDAKENEEPLKAMLRGLLVARLGRSGDPQVVAEARKRFQQHCQSPSSSSLSGDLKKAVYVVALQHGSEKDLDMMLKLYREADSQEERRRVLTSLGSVEDPLLIKRVLDFSIGPEVRFQDTVAGLVGVTGNVEGRELLWRFMKQHWPLLFERFKGGFLLTRLIKHSTEDFCTKQFFDEIKDFFSKNPVEIAARSIKQSLENISLNEQLLSRELESVQQFLTSA